MQAESLIDDEYPFEKQEIAHANFDYIKRDALSDSVNQYAFSAEYREDSELLILIAEDRDDLLPEVLHEIRSTLPSEAKIHPGVGASKKGLWRFVDQAEVIEIKVEQGGQMQILDSIENRENVIGEWTIWSAELHFTREIDNHQRGIDVMYEDGSLSINSNDQEDVEYVIQQFEKAIRG